MANDVKKIRKAISPNKSEDSININETSVTPSDIEIIDNFGSITKQKPTM